MDEAMAYVAADPTQPGAAWACSVDEPKYAKDNARLIAGWVRKGAHVMRVTVPVAREMMAKWERPEKRTRTASVQTGLF